jgi:hypothetical protein
MKNRHAKGLAALCIAVAVLAGAAAAAGVFLRGDGSSAPAVSVRGERYDYAASGVYKFNSLRIVAEGLAWDAVTLVLAVPALLAFVPSLAAGSLRGRLFALGLLFYFFYQYLEYAVFWALGPLFPLHVAVYAASLAGIVWIVSSIDVKKLPEHFPEGFPRRGTAVLCFAVSAVLVGMWVPLVAEAIGGGVDGALHGATTLVVQALDLGLVVPLAVFTGTAALKKLPAGYLLAPVMAVKAAAMGSALCAMIVNVRFVTGRLDAAPLVFFGLAAAGGAWLGLRMHGSILDDKS